MTTPLQRIYRLLDEQARFVAYLPGNIIIDVTPDVATALAAVQTGSNTTEQSMPLARGHTDPVTQAGSKPAVRL